MKRNAILPLAAGAVITAAVIFSPLRSSAGVNVNVGINVPLPALEISAPPALVVIPGTYVYYAPDVDADIVFYHNYWYRPYGGRWYRSASYNGPWGFVAVNSVPGVLLHLPPDYRHLHGGYERIPYGRVRSNWRTWERARRWDRHEGGRGMRHEAREMRRDAREHHREDNRERGRHWNH